MKKIVLVFVFIITMLNVTLVHADGDNSLDKQLSDLLLINDLTAKDKIITASNNYIEELIASEYEFWISVQQKSKAEIAEKNIRKGSTLDPEKTFYFYQLDDTKYSKQYADNYSFEYLINPTKLWYPVYEPGGGTRCYFNDKDGSSVKKGSQMIDKNGREFLYNAQLIEETINNSINEQIIDCKIVSIPLTTILYLKGETTDYGIKIYHSQTYQKDSDSLELFKVYKMSELLNNYAESKDFPEPIMLEEKDIYQTEAESLQKDGILQGTDKGLELLKPLSRIEATTILVRILGLENQTTSATSYFADISSDNWGAKYANIAYDAGITKGVDNGNFAPNQTITSSQFVTLLLRSQGETEIDWQTAINLLVEREIITQAQADKMDLFTRGDMAKIIYEFKNKGLIKNI